MSKRALTSLDYLDFFTTPFHVSTRLEEDFLENLPPQRYNHVVVIGRFQPLHYGHIWIIKYATLISKFVTIGIGSAGIRNDYNPFTIREREYMLEKAIKREGIQSQIQKMLPIYDIEDDKMWIKRTIDDITSATMTVDAVVGNNEAVNSCFRSIGIPNIKVPQVQRGLYQGSVIRKFLKEMKQI